MTLAMSSANGLWNGKKVLTANSSWYVNKSVAEWLVDARLATKILQQPSEPAAFVVSPLQCIYFLTHYVLLAFICRFVCLLSALSLWNDSQRDFRFGAGDVQKISIYHCCILGQRIKGLGKVTGHSASFTVTVGSFTFEGMSLGYINSMILKSEGQR